MADWAISNKYLANCLKAGWAISNKYLANCLNVGWAISKKYLANCLKMGGTVKGNVGETSERRNEADIYMDLSENIDTILN